VAVPAVLLMQEINVVLPFLLVLQKERWGLRHRMRALVVRGFPPEKKGVRRGWR